MAKIPQIKFDVETCLQLLNFGLAVTHATFVKHHIMVNTPIKLGAGCMVYRTKINAYSLIDDACSISNTAIGRYCTLSKDVEIGVAQHDIDSLSSSAAFQHNNDFLLPYDRLIRLNKRQRRISEQEPLLSLTAPLLVMCLPMP